MRKFAFSAVLWYYISVYRPKATIYCICSHFTVSIQLAVFFICWQFACHLLAVFFMPNVFGKKGCFSKRHLTSLVKMAVFAKFLFTSSALPAPSARLPCQQGGEWKFPDTAAAAHPEEAVPRRRYWPAVLYVPR